MSEPKNDFLRDFAALLKRHPSREWARLADLLEDSNARSQIVLFIRGIASLKHAPTKSRGQKTGRARPKGSVRNRKEEFVDRLDSELSLGSMSELRELASKRGLSVSTKDSKQRLIAKILRNSPRARSLEKHKQDSNEYAQWAEIIMGRNKSKQQGG